MSLKDNFNQAVKEILKKDGLVGDELSKESKKKSELDRYLDPPRPAEQPASASEPEPEYDSISAAPVSEPEPESAMNMSAAEPISPAPEQEHSRNYSENPYVQSAQSAANFGRPAQNSDPFGTSRTGGAYNPNSGFGGNNPYSTSNGGYTGFGANNPNNNNGGFGANNYGGYNASGSFGGNGGGIPPRTPNNPPPFRGTNSDTPYYETEETTVISRNTIIDGNIRSFANINIDGSVKGDVKITKNISVTGKVVGDIECNNSVMTGASMQGNIASKGQVQLDRDSILLGDIAAQYLDLNGKIKGNIEVGGKAEFKTDAVVLGNITASTITVLDGATIQGYVNTTFLQESSSSIFPETIAVTE